MNWPVQQDSFLTLWVLACLRIILQTVAWFQKRKKYICCSRTEKVVLFLLLQEVIKAAGEIVNKAKQEFLSHLEVKPPEGVSLKVHLHIYIFQDSK